MVTFFRITWLFLKNQNTDFGMLNAKVNYSEPSVKLNLVVFPHWPRACQIRSFPHPCGYDKNQLKEILSRFKGAVSGLRQVLATQSSVKMI